MAEKDNESGVFSKVGPSMTTDDSHSHSVLTIDRTICYLPYALCPPTLAQPLQFDEPSPIQYDVHHYDALVKHGGLAP